MLYPMMINFRLENATKALRNPKVVLAALAINFVISPPLAALFAHLFFSGGDPYLIAGFILKVTVAGSGMVAAWTGFAKGRVEMALRVGTPWKEIVRAADELEITLIVLGSHGKRSLEELLLGSTVERVTRHASCPVLVVR